jgi:hypothetical protein
LYHTPHERSISRASRSVSSAILTVTSPSSSARVAPKLHRLRPVEIEQDPGGSRPY